MVMSTHSSLLREEVECKYRDSHLSSAAVVIEIRMEISQWLPFGDSGLLFSTRRFPSLFKYLLGLPAWLMGDSPS